MKFNYLMDWSYLDYLWCFHQLFELSLWRHPFTVEDPLVNKWCNAKWRNKLIFFDEEKKLYILDSLKEYNFSKKKYFKLFLWMTYCPLYALYISLCARFFLSLKRYKEQWIWYQSPSLQYYCLCLKVQRMAVSAVLLWALVAFSITQRWAKR